MSSVRATATVDWARLEPWLQRVLPAFWATGYGSYARRLSVADLERMAAGADCLSVAAVAPEDAGGAHGLLIVVRNPWEESVLDQPFARVAFLAADTYALACELAEAAGAEAQRYGAVLCAASPGHAPNYLHVALQRAGFHLGSQYLEVHARLSEIWERVERIPLFGTFREAHAGDAPAIGRMAYEAFTAARFVADPHFPREWGQRLYAAWAEKLVAGYAEVVFVAEGRQGLLGFTSAGIEPDGKTQSGLLAVRRDLPAPGLGAMLTRKMLEWYRARGADEIRLKTEKNNVPVDEMYFGLGFRVIDTGLTYHWCPDVEPASEEGA